MSSYSHTMRSINHSLVKITVTAPKTVGHTSSATTPQTTNTAPTAEIPERMFGTVLWYSGTGTSSRFSHTRSPSTPLAAQLSIDFGAEKRRGFSHVHRRAAAIGRSDHHFSQARLQNARMSSGRTVLRVQTLHGVGMTLPRLVVHSESRRNLALQRHGRAEIVLRGIAWPRGITGSSAARGSPSPNRSCFAKRLRSPKYPSACVSTLGHWRRTRLALFAQYRHPPLRPLSAVAAGLWRYQFFLTRPRKSTGSRIGIPRNGSSSNKSESPLTMQVAFSLTASSRNLSSSGSRQACISSVGLANRL